MFVASFVIVSAREGLVVALGADPRVLAAAGSRRSRRDGSARTHRPGSRWHGCWKRRSRWARGGAGSRARRPATRHSTSAAPRAGTRGTSHRAGARTDRSRGPSARQDALLERSGPSAPPQHVAIRRRRRERTRQSARRPATTATSRGAQALVQLVPLDLVRGEDRDQVVDVGLALAMNTASVSWPSQRRGRRRPAWAARPASARSSTGSPRTDDLGRARRAGSAACSPGAGRRRRRTPRGRDRPPRRRGAGSTARTGGPPRTRARGRHRSTGAASNTYGYRDRSRRWWPEAAGDPRSRVDHLGRPSAFPGAQLVLTRGP